MFFFTWKNYLHRNYNDDGNSGKDKINYFDDDIDSADEGIDCKVDENGNNDCDDDNSTSTVDDKDCHSDDKSNNGTEII